jgi:hypothetical protein
MCKISIARQSRPPFQVLSLFMPLPIIDTIHSRVNRLILQFLFCPFVIMSCVCHGTTDVGLLTVILSWSPYGTQLWWTSQCHCPSGEGWAAEGWAAQPSVIHLLLHPKSTQGVKHLMFTVSEERGAGSRQRFSPLPAPAVDITVLSPCHINVYLFMSAVKQFWNHRVNLKFDILVERQHGEGNCGEKCRLAGGCWMYGLRRMSKSDEDKSQNVKSFAYHFIDT